MPARREWRRASAEAQARESAADRYHAHPIETVGQRDREQLFHCEGQRPRQCDERDRSRQSDRNRQPGACRAGEGFSRDARAAKDHRQDRKRIERARWEMRE